MQLDSRAKPDIGGASGDVKPGDCPAESLHSPKPRLVLQSIVAVFFYVLLNEYDITVLTL